MSIVALWATCYLIVMGYSKILSVLLKAVLMAELNDEHVLLSTSI